MWFQFSDVRTAGYLKTKFKDIYIKANSESDAIKIFEDKFNISPYDSACDCCGYDFWISEDDSLEELTANDRNCDYDYELKKHIERQSKQSYHGEYLTLDEYLKKEDVCIIE